MGKLRIGKDGNELAGKDGGEIDTRAPFQSVKAAASLFGSTISSSSSATKPALYNKSISQPRLDKEAEFQLTQKELGRVKIQVKDAESAANKALPDLEKAMKTLLELKHQIKQVNASKELIHEKTEALKIKSMELEKGQEEGIEAAKEELRRLRGDFESAMEAKLSALKMAEEADSRVEALEKKKKEIEGLREMIAKLLQEEVEGIGKEIDETKKKEADEQTLIQHLQEESQRLKLELEDASLMKTKIEKLVMEAKQAKQEAMDVSNGAHELRRVVEGVQELEREMEMVVKEAEIAIAADRNAQNQLNILYERKNFIKNLGSGVGSGDRDQNKQVLKEEYMSLKEKVSGSKKMAQMKEAAAMAELEKLKNSKIEAEKNLNESLREIEEIARATEEAFKKAESAELARSNAVKELKKRRQEQH